MLHQISFFFNMKNTDANHRILKPLRKKRPCRKPQIQRQNHWVR